MLQSGWRAQRSRTRFASFLAGDNNIEQAQAAQEASVWLEEHRFAEATACIEAFGFRLARISGSHHIYVHPSVPELVNLQNVDGKAKPYQVKQFLQIVEQYDLRLEDEE